MFYCQRLAGGGVYTVGDSIVSEDKVKGEGPVVIKKYANRRLYNTQTSSYVTLDHLAAMVKDGTEFGSRTPAPARTSPAAC